MKFIIETPIRKITCYDREEATNQYNAIKAVGVDAKIYSERT